MANKLAVFFAGLALASCNTQNQSSLAIGENEKIVKQYFEHFNNHAWKELAELYAETADLKDPSLGPGIVKQTRKQIFDKYSELNGVFPDLHDSVIQTYPSGVNHIITEFVSTGTAHDSTKFELPVCTIFKIENGLIVSDFTYYDNFEESPPEAL